MGTVVMAGEIINAPSAPECDQLLAAQECIQVLVKLDPDACTGIQVRTKKRVVRMGTLISRTDIVCNNAPFRRLQFAGIALTSKHVWDVVAELFVPLRKQGSCPCSGTLILTRKQTYSDYASLG